MQIMALDNQSLNSSLMVRSLTMVLDLRVES